MLLKVIIATYAVLVGLILILLVIIFRKRNKNAIELNGAMLGLEELERHAIEIARNHNVGKSTKRSFWLVPRVEDNFRHISQTYTQLNADSRQMLPMVPAAEWLLDNYYVIEEQVRDIKANLTKDYYGELPILKSGFLKGYPRVFAIALELISHTDGSIDEKVLLNFIRSYQSQTLLSMGELWAIAIMLRVALIENIRNICDKTRESRQQRLEADILADTIISDMAGDEKRLDDFMEEKLYYISEATPSFIEHLTHRLRNKGSKFNNVIKYINYRLSESGTCIDDITLLEHQVQASRQISIGNTITSLRMLSNIDWADMFENLSHVEHILRMDPAGIYSEMDFESRDHYRHRIESIAKSCRTSEVQVAHKAVECAQKGKDEGKVVPSHIGYYIIGKGTKELEDGIRCKGGGLAGLKRFFNNNATIIYMGSIIFITLAVTLLFVFYGLISHESPSFALAVLIGLAVLIPSSDIAVTVVNCTVSHIKHPTRLPKLELKNGIPDELKTMVIVPTLLPGENRVKELIGQLEVFYLANKERNLYFALVGDYKDASQEVLPDDSAIVDAALAGIKELNEHYAKGGEDIFYFFHRYRQYNASQGRWMGWERKRGAIIELNDLLRGSKTTSYSITSVDIDKIPNVRFVITLDADTILPMGNAKRLIGTLAHPLNRVVKDEETGAVIEGYGILQPRIGVSVISAGSTLFSRVFAGQGGIDPYTTAVSDVYQDLFGEGIYTGKGIYEVDVFQSALKNSIPDNSILSHDLLEGSYVHTGLVTDIELIDGYPAKYNSYAMRLHRWVRGDWQLLPWLFGYVRNRAGNKVKNPLSVVSKWKILDNMRRSLLSPALFFLIILGFLVLPGSSLVWMGLALVTICSPVIVHLVNTALAGCPGNLSEKRHSTVIFGFNAIVLQALIMLIFIPYQAFLMLDAILRTLGRVLFTRKNMLEWVTAADMESRLKNNLESFIRRMWVSPAAAVLLAFLVYLRSPVLLLGITALILLWLLAPYVAYRLSLPYRKKRSLPSEADNQILRRIARKTWGYFEDLTTEQENYLPPDNYQENPPKGTAHRTSPTNIGLFLMSTMTARDMGYISTTQMLHRMDKTITTLERMEKWKGHLFNWYDTHTLEVLRPAYISTVDSGNLVAYLMVLAEGIKEYLKRPLLDPNLVRGLKDTLDLYNSERSAYGIEAIDVKQLEVLGTRKEIDTDELFTAISDLQLKLQFQDDEEENFKFQWKGKVLLQIESLLEDALLIKPLMEAGFITQQPSFREIHEKYSEYLALEGSDSGNKDSDKKPGIGINEAFEKIKALKDLFYKLLERINKLVSDTSFLPLFDPKRQLFSIGYNVEDGHLSKSYYDLFASEARQASYIAITRGEVDKKHWFRMGRKLTKIGGYKGLVSWTGTMFEYLMPLLIMKNYDCTLMDETYSFVVNNQKGYAARKGLPWGISESGYNAFDLNLNYQYKAFGIPGLGLRRGLENELVISPYSTLLALMVDPAGAVDNVKRLIAEDMEAFYGLYEAIDYTPGRLGRDEKSNIVRSFMAHHQGMSLVAIDNYFHNNIMQKRFHSNPAIRAGELLLQEKIPSKVIFTNEHKADFIPAKKTEQEAGEVVRIYGMPDSELPHVHMLSNGSYSVMLTNGGTGFSRYYDTAITRWRENSPDNSGMFIFIENINSNTPWTATFSPFADKPQNYRAVFSPDKAEFFRRDGSIETHTEITVSPENNVEIRKVSLTNRSQSSRILELTSYFEVVLAHPDEDAAHPAFCNLFVRTEFVKQHNCLLASRRPRDEMKKGLWAVHSVVSENDTIGDVSYETDRARFIGRNRTLKNPVAMDVDQPLTNTTGAVLDPVMSLRVRIRLEPGQTSSVAFIAGIAENRKNAMELAEKYKEMKVLERAFELSWTRSQIEMKYFGFKQEEVKQYFDLMPAVIFSSPLRKLWKERIQKNSKGQAGLWPYGISGDLPIVLVVVSSVDECENVFWALRAHDFWRMKGLIVDLVILCMDDGGYTRPLLDLVRDAVAGSHGRELQEKRGGVFVRDGRIIKEEDIDLLFTAARVVINEGVNRTIEQLEEILKRERFDAPEIFSARPEKKPVAYARAESFKTNELKFFNGIGGFSRDGREYIVCLDENNSTPAPWINVIANPNFGFLISEAGSSYTWSENSRENKLTPWSNDPVSDPSGEAIYVRDEEDGEFWSITPQPIREKGEYVIRHGHGYSVFQHESHGLKQMLAVFASLEEAVKLMLIKFKNTTQSERTISVTYYIRPVLGVSDKFTSPYIITRLDNEKELLLITNAFPSDFPGRIVFMGSSEREPSFTGDRWEFIGVNGSMEDPQAMKAKTLSGNLGAGLDPCGAMQVKISLPPDGEKELVFLLGEGKSMDEVLKLSEKYANVKKAKNELDRVKKFWQSKLFSIKVSTPDLSMDIMLNSWLLYQVLACRLWARSAFYQSGGAYGFRDQLQDAMAVVYTYPEITRKQILLHASRQFVEGDVQHWWHDEVGKGIRTKYSDDLLWLPFVTADYIKATGDLEILNEKVGYLEGNPLEENEDERYDIPIISQESSTLYEHCIRAIERAARLGQHGIPLMGSGDWNDGMNTVGNKGKGESVWLGWFLYTALQRFVPLCREMKDDERVARYSALMEQIKESIEANAWDGSWYRRAYFDNGIPLGSVKNTECRIDSISQSWSVISGAGKPSRSQEAMDAVEKYLINREEGIIKLLAPPFDEGDLKPGYIKGYVPGVRENGGQYTHAAVWVIIAFALMGKGEKAWEMFHMINPINHSSTSMEYSRYKVEPYVMAADVYAVYPNAGRGGWTWYTGAAGWMYRAGVEYLLGIKKQGDTLRIDPCIPKKWQGFKVRYKNGNTIYDIEVRNPSGVNIGVIETRVDSNLCENHIIKLTDDGKQHNVQVIMG